MLSVNNCGARLNDCYRLKNNFNVKFLEAEFCGVGFIILINVYLSLIS
jgi:hypothetical protein